MSRRILHVVPYLAEAAGGPPVVVRRLVEGARNANWQADIVTSRDLLPENERQALLESGVTIMSSQLSALVGDGAQELKAAVQYADLLHCHTLWSPLVSRSAAIARHLRIPYILAPHGMLDPYSFRQHTIRKRLYLESVERRTVDAAAKVMFTTWDERALAEKTFGLISNSAVVALGADRLPKERQLLRDRFFEQHPDLRGRQLLLFMGRLHPKKRPELLPDVISAIQSKFPQATLVLAGAGEENYVNDIKRRVRGLAVDSKVRFLGHLSGEAKFSALAAADIFLLPSNQENFGIAVAEAMHAGLPVVLTKKVNIWREIEEAGAGIAVADDDLVRKLADAASAILSDGERWTRMSANAQKLANDAFSWEASCKLTLEIYEDVLAEF